MSYQSSMDYSNQVLREGQDLINGADYTWEYVSPTPHPEASPLVTAPQYSQYPSGWGVKTATPVPYTNYSVRGTGGSSTGGTEPYGNTGDMQAEINRLRGMQNTTNRSAYQTSYNSPADNRNYMAEAELAAQVERERIAAENARAAQELMWYREEQAAALEAERQQRLATLAAQPKSWLEYAALANQPPVVQPWMLPLLPRQYSNLQAGQPIPGWEANNMQGMPNLTRPSAQYMARLAPVAQEQYYGYQQADMGAPDDTMYWLNQSTAPPGSSYKPLSYQR